MEVTYKDHMGDDLSVVNAARVSFGKSSEWEWKYPYHEKEWDDLAEEGWSPDDPWTCFEWKRLAKADQSLIKYLAKHEHYSPFGHCFISLHVKAPIFVARQLVKHKFLRWNEISRRYVDTEPEFYTPEVWRGRSADKKQGSEGIVESVGSYDPAILLEDYNGLLDLGVCPEQARMVLPQSTMTEWWWSGSLDAFTDTYNLRAKPDAQKETQEIARQIKEIVEPLFPCSWSALTTRS